jgi:hypothetical protein
MIIKPVISDQRPGIPPQYVPHDMIQVLERSMNE